MPFAWRFRMPNLTLAYTDRVADVQLKHAARDLGDFVVYKSDGTPA